jgi:hypothetical protein
MPTLRVNVLFFPINTITSALGNEMPCINVGVMLLNPTRDAFHIAIAISIFTPNILAN